jgi:osmotically-inducible protein OsmY
MIDGVREVYNELGVGPVSSLGSRSTDSFIDSKVKARLVDSNQISANHIKVVTERAIVHLMGIVNDREAKVAVAVARTTSGVKKVVNLMEIVGDDDIRRIDSQTLGSRNPPPANAPVETR